MATVQLPLFPRPLPPCQFLIEDVDTFMHMCNKPARYVDCTTTFRRSAPGPAPSYGPACLEHACKRHHPKYENHVVEIDDNILDWFIRVLGVSLPRS